MPWQPPAGTKFFARVALTSQTDAKTAPPVVGKAKGPPITGAANSPRHVKGAICALAGDDSWQVGGGLGRTVALQHHPANAIPYSPTQSVAPFH